MTINEIYLDDFDKQEYIHFIKSLLEYYYIQFNEILELKEGE